MAKKTALSKCTYKINADGPEAASVRRLHEALIEETESMAHLCAYCGADKSRDGYCRKCAEEIRARLSDDMKRQILHATGLFDEHGNFLGVPND
jgi:hypothetical protein